MLQQLLLIKVFFYSHYDLFLRFSNDIGIFAPALYKELIVFNNVALAFLFAPFNPDKYFLGILVFLSLGTLRFFANCLPLYFCCLELSSNCSCGINLIINSFHSITIIYYCFCNLFIYFFIKCF